MRSQTLDRNVVSSGSLAKGSFGISLDNQAFLMRILRDTLYTDKILAVLREYSANAWDAHVEAGIPEVPIKVTLPTELEPRLIIRDFGLGLSEEGIFHHYTQYGDSSKRDSDDAVGLFGIGCKSGFAYGDSFTITSYHEGEKKVYVASLDQDDMGDITLMSVSPCGDETGIEIKIAVRPHDVGAFRSRAQRLFPFFHPFPDINDETVQPVKVERLRHGYFGDVGHGHWVGVMGCIPYRLNIQQVQEMLEDRGIWEFAQAIQGGLFFDIGEVKINASREELEYVDKTKNAIVTKFRFMRKEFIEQLKTYMEDPEVPGFDKRLKVLQAAAIGVGAPKGYGHFSVKQVPVYGRVDSNDKSSKNILPPRFWRLQHSSGVRTQLHERTWVELGLGGNRIILRDTPRSIRGYDGLHQGDMWVTPPDRPAWGEDEKIPQAVLDELNEFLLRADLDGIEIIRSSKLDWYAPRVHTSYGSGTTNQKHRVNCFRLTAADQSPLSANWEIVDRETSEDDVYLIINRFEGIGFRDFYKSYREDSALAKAFGIEMPEVYGYKTTQKKPVVESELDGISYAEWRGDLASRIVTKNPWLKTLFKAMFWRSVISQSHTWGWTYKWPHIFDWLNSELPPKHPLRVFFQKHRWGVKKWEERPKTFTPEQIDSLYRQTARKGHVPAAIKARDRIFERYPLLQKGGGSEGWAGLGKESREHWLHYIRLIDASEDRNDD